MLFVVAVALAAVWVVVLRTEALPPNGLRTPRVTDVQQESSVDELASPRFTSERPSAARTGVGEVPSSTAGERSSEGDWMTVVMLDEALGAPIPGGTVKVGPAPVAWTGLDGKARVPVPGGGLRPLTCSAPDFESSTVMPPANAAGSRLDVWLRPAWSTTVRVVDEAGQPYRGVRVRLAHRSSLQETDFGMMQAIEPSAWTESATTDALGVVQFRLAATGIGEAFAPSGASAQFRVCPERELLVELSREPAALRVIDSKSGGPLANFALGLTVTSDPIAREVQIKTNERGEVPIPVGRAAVTVRVKDPRRNSCEFARHPALIPGAYHNTAEISAAAKGDVFRLSVDVCSVPFRLVSVASGLPVEGLVQIEREKAYSIGEGTVWRSQRVLRRSALLEDGRVDIDCVYLSNRKTFRTSFTVSGYRTAHVIDADCVKNGPVMTLELTGGTNPVDVSVLYADGAPYVGQVILGNKVTGATEKELLLDPVGMATLQHWDGGAISVDEFSGSGGGFKRVELGVIEADEVAEGRAALVLEDAPARGSLVVLRGESGQAPMLFAMDGANRMYQSRQTTRGALFEALPEGAYVVGPRSWLSALAEQNVSPGQGQHLDLSTQIVSGQETVVAWDGRWALEAPLVGRVMAENGLLSSLYLLPWYGNRRGSISPFEHRRLTLDPDGRYVLRAGQPRPEVLLVCRADAENWVSVIQAFEPGDDIRLSCGALRLEWEGTPPAQERATVIHSLEPPSFESAFEDTSRSALVRRWVTTSPIVLTHVSLACKEIKVRVDGYENKSISVKPVEGQIKTVRISLDELTKID